MDNEVVAFKSWLDAYGHAWENRDPEAATALFTEDGTYRKNERGRTAFQMARRPIPDN